MAEHETPVCYHCDQPAEHECRRCGRAYCATHGGAVCAECQASALALPSAALYRGTLATLAIGVIVGLWVLIAPPTLPGERRLAKSSAQNPAGVQAAPRVNARGAGAAGASPVASPTATPATLRSYTVQLNDTLNGIAASFGTSVSAIQTANPGVDQTNLRAGQDLLVPPPSSAPTATPAP